jgi:hypothetical protein
VPVHVTVTVSVSSAGLQVLPAGTGPSPTTRVTVTGPGVEQVNEVLAAVAEPKKPLLADHAYVRFAGTGPVADAVSATGLPIAVSTGLADTAFHAAQSNDVPLTVVWPPDGAMLHAI